MKKNIYLPALTTGILLWAAWPVSPLAFLLFIGFVPLLYLSEVIERGRRYFAAAYIAMLVWNAGSTWWICNSTLPGGVAAILANSLLMSIPLLGFFKVKKSLGRDIGYFAFIGFWLFFEYVHLNWQLSWPWLTLGNGFASHPDWVQWYEYTGSSGGSLWVVLVNVLLYESLRRSQVKDFRAGRNMLVAAVALIILPLVTSLLIKQTIHEPPAFQSEVVVLQPNIDPYEKFSPGSQQKQMDILTQLSDSAITPATKLVIWPETSLHNDAYGIDLDRLDSNPYLEQVRSLLKAHPGLSVFSGIEGIRFFTEETKDEFSRKTGSLGIFYDSYNAASILDSSGSHSIYYKSKFVPGVETLPTYLRFMEKLFEQFGGTTGGYASQKERTVMHDTNSHFAIAPAICYESVYGEFLAEYVCNGANLIVIITNDGWWANTWGHKQHAQYARLRAIETRRWIARSANTGISCFVSPSGELLHQKPWDTRGTLTMTLPALTELTFFVKHGDLISPVAIGISCLLIVWYVIKYFRTRGMKKG